MEDLRRKTALAHEQQAGVLIRGKLADAAVAILSGAVPVEMRYGHVKMAMEDAIKDSRLIFGKDITSKALVNWRLQAFDLP